MSCDKCVCDSGDLPIEDLVHDSEFVYQPMFEHAVVVDVPYKKT